MQVAAHVEEGRRARPAVEILVGAAYGQVGVGCVQVHRHGAGRMAQVPQRQRAGLVGQRRECGHVVGVGAFEGGVRQADQRGVFVDGRGQGLDRAMDAVGRWHDLQAMAGA